ncbi:MAG TPA: FtsX-like permease family protein [Bacteroidales bacterium]|nr:FtsX-like permease family protein [Bacteroidales bacterium]HRZ48003.1 FtsX-like permease family protein [Bacteroidales bacterium]
MQLPLFIARRYLFSRKKHHAINLVSAISAVGIMGGSIAFILVLSVFNGFEQVVISLFSSFEPDLKITAVEGKTFRLSDTEQKRIRETKGVAVYQEVVEEMALLRYKEKQHIALLKGVEEGYTQMTGIDTMMYAGAFQLNEHEITRGVLGAGVAYKLGIQLDDFEHPVDVFLPDRTASVGDVASSFSHLPIYPAGIFSIQQDIDNKYVLVPVGFVRDLMHYESEVTSIELGVADQAMTGRVKSSVREILGDRYRIQDKFEQQELLYRIIHSEKWAIFAILAFILLLAIFNVVGSLTLLILEKRKDIAVLQTMGATNRTIRKIFLLEGLQISFWGNLAGLLIGGLLAFVQQRFGIIGIGQADTLVIDAYPVKLNPADFLLIFATVTGIGLIASWLPVRRLSKQYIDTKL